MTNCANLYFLSTLACALSECLSTDELTLLSADLVALGDLLDSVLARQSVCDK